MVLDEDQQADQNQEVNNQDQPVDQNNQQVRELEEMISEGVHEQDDDDRMVMISRDPNLNENNLQVGKNLSFINRK